MTSLPTISKTLPEQIYASSRAIHAQLNHLVTVRLPLALPPHAASSSIYTLGLLHIAPIYVKVESIWESTLDHSTDPSSVLGLLTRLRLPGLLRTGRLRADIQLLSGMPTQMVDEQLDQISSVGKVAEFVAHIQNSIQAKPHVLVAYTWLLYMALFSGGRILRAALRAAGADFWTVLSKPHTCLEHAQNLDVGLQFFAFPGDEDGQDIKCEFRKRILEADVMLTEVEKEDIIQESQHIFNSMIEIVVELDKICNTPQEMLHNETSAHRE